MADAPIQVQHDFWKPPVSAASPGVVDRTGTCRCGTEFIVSSIFCHSCGAKRPDISAARILGIPGVTEIIALGEHLALPIPSVLAFLAGVFCLVGAVSVSVFFTAHTTLDWQAIQFWRIEWLLAAVAAFAAGCLLKRRTDR